MMKRVPLVTDVSRRRAAAGAFDGAFGDGEAEAAAFHFAAARAAVEAFEDRFALVGRDAGAFVG